MLTAFNKGATLIALKDDVKAGGRTHHPGDHFRWRQYALTERRVGQLIDQRTIGELSQESFDLALARRAPEHGVVPWGFTRDGLEAVGIKVPNDTADEVDDSSVGLDYDEIFERDGLRIGAKKAGIADTFDVFDGEARLNTARIRGKKQLETFLESVKADRARIARENSPDTQPTEAGEGDGDPAVPAEADVLGDGAYGED